MNGSRDAFLKIGATASTSWLPAGPTIASTLESAWSFVPVGRRLGRIELRVPLDELDLAAPELLIAYFAKPSCSLPMKAASPVIGPWKPILGASQPALGAAVAAGPSTRAIADAATASAATHERPRPLPTVSWTVHSMPSCCWHRL